MLWLLMFLGRGVDGEDVEGLLGLGALLWAGLGLGLFEGGF